MGETTKIEWCDHTFNPWIGCQKVSAGCDHCYAEALMDTRWGKVEWGPHGERKRTSAANWKQPLRWAKAARSQHGLYPHAYRRPRVFCASLADVFDNQAPDQWRSDLFALIEATPELDWLLLTKRPENIAEMLWPKWDAGLPRNIWLGTTCEDQKNFDHRWPILRAIPAAVRFVSYEPAIGVIYDTIGPSPGKLPDWIIMGGESGHGARMMNPEWARLMRESCRVRGIAFFMKQMTAKTPIPADLLVRQFPRIAA